MTNLISFDWAMKRLLRDKANHAVLEGLMTSLLNEKFTARGRRHLPRVLPPVRQQLRQGGEDASR